MPFLHDMNLSLRQTKGRLGNPEVRPAVDNVLSQELTRLFDFCPEILNAMHEQVEQEMAKCPKEENTTEVLSSGR